MKLYSRILIMNILLALLNFSQIFALDELKKIDSARELVEKFCRAEFMGVQDIRLDIAKYSRKQRAWEKKRDSEFRGMVKYWDNDPLFVVESYQITDVSVKKTRAIATIVYKRVAMTEGDGVLKRKLIPDRMSHDIVKLHLIYNESRWWVLDPPIPRVSLEAIIEYHKNYYKIMGDDWLQRIGISESQKQYYRKLQENLEILNRLRLS
jgi:hypothetical protein